MLAVGMGLPSPDLLCVKVATGIGAGTIPDCLVQRGAQGTATGTGTATGARALALQHTLTPESIEAMRLTTATIADR